MATIYTSRVSLRDTDTGLWLYGRAHAVYSTSTTDTAVTISGTYYFEISKASSEIANGKAALHLVVEVLGVVLVML